MEMISRRHHNVWSHPRFRHMNAVIVLQHVHVQMPRAKFQWRLLSRITWTSFVSSQSLKQEIRGKLFNASHDLALCRSCSRSFSVPQLRRHQWSAFPATADSLCARTEQGWETRCCLILSSWSAISTSNCAFNFVFFNFNCTFLCLFYVFTF